MARAYLRPPAIVCRRARQFSARESSRRGRRRQHDLGELLGAADARRVRSSTRRVAPTSRVEMTRAAPARRVSRKPPGALLDDVAGDLRHARRRRAGPRRERKDMQMRRARIRRPDRASARTWPRSRSGSRRSGRRRTPCRAAAARTSSQNAIASRARMPALHALEDEVVARLQRQMQMRHQPLFLGERVEQIAVGLDRIDRGQPQPLQLRHVLEDLLAPACRASARPAGRRRSW